MERLPSQEILRILKIEAYDLVMSFDLGKNGKYVDGKMVIEHNNIHIIEKKKHIISYNIKDFSSFGIVKVSNGGYLYGRKNDDNDIIIVRFSNTYFDDIAPLALSLNNLVKNDKFIIPSIRRTHCPICNTPYEKGSNFCVYCNKQKGIFKTFIPYLLKYKWLLLAQILISVITVGINTIRPQLFEKIIDNHLVAGLYDNDFVILFVLLSLTYLVATISTIIVGGIVDPKIANGISKDIRVKIYDKVHKLSISSANEKTTGSLITRIINDSNEVSNFISENLNTFIFAMIQLVVVIFIMMFDDYRLALLIFLPIPIMQCILIYCWKKIRTKYDIRWKYLSGTNNVLHDIINGIKIVKIYGKEKKEVARFKKENEKLKKIDVKVELFWATIMPSISIFTEIIFAIIYVYLGNKILNLELGYGSIIKWSSYAAMAFSLTSQLTALPRVVNRVKVSAGKIVDLLNENTEELPKTRRLDKINGDIVFKDVKFGYTNYVNVLKDCTFSIKAGETIGIVGYSGSGKTTLVNLIMKLYNPNDGTITIDGVDLNDLDPVWYRKNLGVVLQETLLFSGTIFDNIKYGKDDATYEDVIRVAKIADAHNFILDKPFGYETVLGKQGEGLSGGQKQRIAIARALLHDPQMFIFDEATSSLDTMTEVSIQEKLSEISKGKTTFIIAHRLSTLKDADRLLVFNDGTLEEIGTHEELMKKKGYYHGLVEAQLMNYGKKS